ncbi:MAG: nicotinate-nucleotide adenylyltransferase [Roseburia sp.]|nr:nicotinate-nucleotide adenylyltransferase [Roseburia sp.]
MLKTGIMGGTFNPIHNVHLIMAEEARKQFDLDEIWFMPSKNPPHKEKDELASDEHRRRMIEHSIQDNPHFRFSGMELEREGITYTKDTLEELKKMYPEHEFYFIMGGDSLATMDKWNRPDLIFQNCHVLAANRDQTDNPKIQEWIHFYKQKYEGAQISEIAMPSISISSEMIRKKLAAGRSISDYCPATVAAYIKYNALYGFEGELFEKEPSDREIVTYLSACLRPKRLFHTLGVAVTAANLAAVHGCDPADAYRAGLLHDCAKYLTGNEQKALCRQYGISLTSVELENPVLIHGKLGAFFARTKYHVGDEGILSAIQYHTTGRPGMSSLEKILYLADYMEPGRNMKCKPYSLKKIRKACFSDLDKALNMVLENSVDYLQSSGKPVDEQTIKTYEYYKK